MTHKLVVCIRNITEDQKQAMRDAAQSRGWTCEIYDNKEEALTAAKNAEVVFADSPRYALDAPDLRWIISPSAGVNHFIKSDHFRESGVMLSNSSGAYGVTIAEHIVMAALTMLRRLPEYQEHVRAKNWTRGYTLKSIKDARITVIGTGDIGQEAARRLKGFGPERIVGVNTSGENPDAELFDWAVPAATPGSTAPAGEPENAAPAATLDAVLPETDILIMAIPATPLTYHLMNEKRLAMLPDGALIVNVGRGTTIDEPALIRELKSGRLRAALDVFEKEPIPEDSELWDCPNLLITPHVSGDMYLPYTVQRIVDLFIEDFLRYTEGEKPLRFVDLGKGY